MPRVRVIGLLAVVAGTLGLAACAQSPVAPATLANGASAEARASAAPSGFYTLVFLHDLQEVTTLPAGSSEMSHVIVKVHVEDMSHQPATSGSVLYEVCTYRATGKAAPSSACADGTARWKRWVNVEINSSGDTYAGIDVVHNPCTMGWRATYGGSKTIAPATMGPVDFIWT